MAHETIDIICATCGDVVGAQSAADAGNGLDAKEFTGHCPGRGKHRSERFEERVYFGLVKEVTMTYHDAYPEEGSLNSWHEYTGPPSRFWLWVAIMLTDGVLVDGAWVWWRLDSGFFGDGYNKLFKKDE